MHTAKKKTKKNYNNTKRILKQMRSTLLNGNWYEE